MVCDLNLVVDEVGVEAPLAIVGWSATHGCMCAIGPRGRLLDCGGGGRSSKPCLIEPGLFRQHRDVCPRAHFGWPRGLVATDWADASVACPNK